jgi:hypothetical protein
MNKTQELRQNAENCSELARAADSDPAKKRYERMADGWRTVADAQQWLDGHRTAEKES